MRTVRFDPHVHTAASYDSTAPVEAVLEHAREAGLDALAVTDHDTTASVRRALELADELTVVPGVEVSTADGHLLALGVTTAPEPGRPLAETVAVVRDRGGVAVVPHPFQRSRHGVGRRALRACPGVGVEAYNAVAMTGLQNRRAQAFAREHDRPTLGGSDAHKPAAVGRAYTEVGIPTAEPLSSDLLLSAVRAGATTHVGRRTPLREYVTKVAHNVRLRTAATLFARGRSTR